MAINISFLKRLVKEDFPKQYQDLVGRIAFVLNPAIQQLINVLNHGLAIGDLNTQVKTITTTVDSNGIPINTLSFQTSLTSKCSFIQVGRALNITNSTTYPTSGHSVSFIENNGLITIQHITGLTANDSWQLIFIAYA